MSDVTRHDFTCFPSGRVIELDRDEGKYVLHSDYAALLTRHNAVVEAVKWERECEDVAHWRYEVWEMAEVGSGDCEIYTVAQCIRDEARAEVDRLLEEK